MCDNCSNTESELKHLDQMELDESDIAIMALSIVGALVENYCEEGYCDPTMYKALALAEKLAQKLEHERLAERLTTTKIFAGETVNKLIDENQMPISKEGWA
jgi:hypothetical protein